LNATTASAMPLAQHLRLWLMRLLLAALLLASHEILLWANIQTLTSGDWLIHSIAYVGLATLLLDVAVRYRIRDLYDAMALLAFYAAIGGLLISPDISFSDLPRTLVTRVLGAYCLTGAVGFGIFLALTTNQPRYWRLMVAGMAWVGFYWGTWLRWTPEVGSLFTEPVALGTMLTYAGVLYGIALLFNAAVQRTSYPITPADFKLRLVPGLLLILGLLLIFLLRATQNLLDGAALIICVALMGISLAILWFRRSPKGDTLLDQHIPPRRINLLWLILTIGVFTLTTTAAYALPLIGTPEFNQLWVMELGYVGVGIGWMPTLAAVIAVRGVDRQMRAQNMDI
jgi:hypothetical protein